jgi:hypothetical protein
MTLAKASNNILFFAIYKITMRVQKKGLEKIYGQLFLLRNKQAIAFLTIIIWRVVYPLVLCQKKIETDSLTWNACFLLSFFSFFYNLFCLSF